MSSETKTGPGSVVMAILTAPAVWLERARGKQRIALLAIYFVIATGLGLVGWRNWALRSIPNLRDPFADLPPPASQFAMPGTKFALYQKAMGNYHPLIVYNQQFAPFGFPKEPWEHASAERLAWLESNRQALDLWVKAAELESVRTTGAGVETGFPLGYIVGNMEVFELCEFEADRLESKGDLAGAWRLHRAVLQSCQEISASSPGYLSNQINWSISNTVGSNLSRWVSDPRVTPAMLEAARDDIRAIADRPLVEPQALRTIYQAIIEQLENPGDPLVQTVRADMNPPDEQMQWYHSFPPTRWARWFLLSEPERGKRVTRLIFANYRAYFEASGASRSASVPYVIPWVGDPRYGRPYGNLILYDDGKAVPSRVPSPAPTIPPPPGVTTTSVTLPGGVAPAMPPKIAAIAAGLESSPLLKRILLSQQQQLPNGAPSIQTAFDGFIGLIDGEIAIRKLPPDARDAERDLINPDSPSVLPEETVLP